MKSSIIKAVTQTQFKTCVTAFIALLLNDGGKSCPKLVLRLYLVGQLSFNDSIKSIFKIDTKRTFKYHEIDIVYLEKTYKLMKKGKK